MMVGLMAALAFALPSSDGDGIHVSPTEGGLQSGVASNNTYVPPPSNGQSGEEVAATQTESEPGLDELFCTGTNYSADSCESEPTPDEPVLTGEMVSQAFAFTPLPASTLIIQPPNGRTLVNFDTNFYTDAPAEQIIAVTLLDQVVELRVWPASFTWNFGDGATTQTTERGAAYPALDITHKYLRKGEVAPSLDTTYAAEWRLQGTAGWQPVVGTVTIAGEPSALQVLTATPTLVG